MAEEQMKVSETMAKGRVAGLGLFNICELQGGYRRVNYGRLAIMCVWISNDERNEVQLLFLFGYFIMQWLKKKWFCAYPLIGGQELGGGMNWNAFYSILNNPTNRT